MSPDPAVRKAGFRQALLRALDGICGEIAEDAREHLHAEMTLFDIPAGATLYRQGDAGDSMHIVLSGRLQVSVDQGTRTKVLARPQPGDVVGEVALIAGNPRAATVIAQRHTTVGELRRAAIDTVVGRHPSVFTNLARMVVERLSNRRGHIGERTGARTFLVLRVGAPPPDLHAFRIAVSEGLGPYGRAVWIGPDQAQAKAAAEGPFEYGRWLDDCEREHDFVFLEVDEPTQEKATDWAEQALGHADAVLLVGSATSAPVPRAAERWLRARLSDTRPHGLRCELILLHPPGSAPRNTRLWTHGRELHRHLHMHPHDRASGRRLARLLAGRAVSLVLAGGGARGFAHLGVLRALRDVGVPIDTAGGTSFGALAASGPARGMTWEALFQEEHTAFSKENPLGDYTFPAVSLVAGAHLDRLLQKYMSMDIEDLLLPFFAMSTDLSANASFVHDTGPLWAAIRASVSLPGILPPVLSNGNLLVDGGLLNNFPSDVMRSRQPGLLIGVDLTDSKAFRHDESTLPSGRAYLQSLMPWQRRLQSPMILSILIRGLTLAGRRTEAEKAASVDLFLHPPMDEYGLLDWVRLREIEEVGYAYARPRVDAWLAEHPELV